MDPSEAVEYLRKDVHDAIIAKQAKAAIRGMDVGKPWQVPIWNKPSGYMLIVLLKRLKASVKPMPC